MPETITVTGNICSDPELKFTKSGAAVASFTIADTPRFLDKTTNEWKDGETLFLRCSVWRDAAENAAESLRKGTRVIAIGKLKQRSYEVNGDKRTSIELDVQEIGPSLKNATASVTKKGGGGYRGDGAAAAPAKNTDLWGGSADDDAPPF